MSERVASATIRVTAINGCNYSGTTQTRDYYLVRPFHGSGMHRTSPAGTTLTTGNPAPLLYPNPPNEELRIVAPSPATHYDYVVIVNAQGTVVREVRATGGVQQLTLMALPAGIYAVRLFDGQKLVTRQIEKQ